jgi:hypothetical protein
MDIHKPKAAHSPREFLIEIGTITVGILIALGLESLIELNNHHWTAEFARTSIQQELQHNRDDIRENMIRVNKLDQRLQTVIAYTQARVAGRSPSPLSLDINGSFFRVGDAAWQAALSTQALSHFGYKQAMVVSSAYNSQQELNAEEQRTEESFFEVLGDMDDLSDSSGPDLRQTLRRLRITKYHIQGLREAERVTVNADSEALASLS